MFQTFVWGVNVLHAKKDPNEVLPVDKSKAKDDGQTGISFHCALLF